MEVGGGGGAAKVSCHGITVLASLSGVAVVTTFWLQSEENVEHGLKIETESDVQKVSEGDEEILSGDN